MLTCRHVTTDGQNHRRVIRCTSKRFGKGAVSGKEFLSNICNPFCRWQTYQFFTKSDQNSSYSPVTKARTNKFFPYLQQQRHRKLRYVEVYNNEHNNKFQIQNSNYRCSTHKANDVRQIWTTFSRYTALVLVSLLFDRLIYLRGLNKDGLDGQINTNAEQIRLGAMCNVQGANWRIIILHWHWDSKSNYGPRGNSFMKVRWIVGSTEKLTVVLEEPGCSPSGPGNRLGGPHRRWHAASKTKIYTPGRG